MLVKVVGWNMWTGVEYTRPRVCKSCSKPMHKDLKGDVCAKCQRAKINHLLKK